MPRARDLGITIGSLPTGPTNSVLDVAGVGLGHATVWRDEPDPPEGRGIARTGVTCLLLAEDAFHRPLPAGGAVLNGAGECTGFITAAEWGAAETPVYLDLHLQLGRVYDAACRIELERDAAGRRGRHDPGGRRVRRLLPQRRPDGCRWTTTTSSLPMLPRWRRSARRRRPTREPSASGTGMSCFDFKGGIGTASRVTPQGHTVGVLLMTNFGVREECVVAGVPVGRLLPPSGSGPHAPAGSCIGVVVTDAPVDGASCARLARRVGLGLARTGSVAHHGSGEIFLGVGTGMRLDRDGRPDGPALASGRALDPLFAAVVEATEEAVLNSMLTAPTVVGRAGHTSETLHTDEVMALLDAVRS